MQFVSINRAIRPDLTMTFRPHLQALTDHVTYMKDLHEQSKVLIAGGFTDASGGLDIIEVPTIEEALKICDDDPLHKAMHIMQEIHPYVSDLGPRLVVLRKMLEDMA